VSSYGLSRNCLMPTGAVQSTLDVALERGAHCSPRARDGSDGRRIE
jgi:hypothetical protein